MRKKICIAIMSIILAGCLMDVEYDLLFHNNSNKTIIFYPTFSGEDTIPLGTEFCIAPYTAAIVLWSQEYDFLDQEYALYRRDTLCWNVKNRSNDSVIQQYFLSLPDMKYIMKHDGFAFPPSPTMRNMKMWPPYGTYDAHGNRMD